MTKWWKGWLVGVAVTGTSLASVGLKADTPSESAIEEPAAVIYVYGTRETYREIESSSATRTPTPIEDLPQSLFVITRDVIDDQAMTGLAELVRYVPGVTMGQGEGHRDAPVFRGNLTTSDFFVDGVRDDLQYLRDLYNVERVDVLKGPSALVYGRGTGGGALNRVFKSADGERTRAFEVLLGMYGQSRVAVDVGDTFGDDAAGRLNVVHEDSKAYRNELDISRTGLAPAWRTQLTEKTRLEVFGEYFADERVVDRGVPSQDGRPWRGPRDTYFGNPDFSNSDITVLTGRGVLSHEFKEGLSMRATLSLGDYEKFYDNVYAGGPVDAITNRSSIAAYLASTDRRNLLAQLDFVWAGEWDGHEQTVLLGFEAGRQESVNLRVNSASAMFPITDRGRYYTPDFSAAPAANNRNELDVAAVLLQNQIALTPTVNVVVGVRWDVFDLTFDDLRANAVDFARQDEFLSPKAGVVWKPMESVSFYGGWSKAYLPQSGEQFNSLTASLSALAPETFENLELGVRWQPSSSLLMSAAVYRLDRANTRAPGPIPGSIVLTGAQRSEGIELGIQGEARPGWHLIGALALQKSEITASTSAAPTGRMAPLVPRFSASLWNRWAVLPGFDLALGVIHQGEQFASITNAVALPSYTRVDAAAFYSLSESTSIQLNIENLTDERYWFTAHNDDNITPGSGVLARLTVSTRF